MTQLFYQYFNQYDLVEDYAIEKPPFCSPPRSLTRWKWVTLLVVLGKFCTEAHVSSELSTDFFINFWINKFFAMDVHTIYALMFTFFSPKLL